MTHCVQALHMYEEGYSDKYYELYWYLSSWFQFGLSGETSTMCPQQNTRLLAINKHCKVPQRLVQVAKERNSKHERINWYHFQRYFNIKLLIFRYNNCVPIIRPKVPPSIQKDKKKNFTRLNIWPYLQWLILHYNVSLFITCKTL